MIIFSLGPSANNALMIMIWETQPKVVGAGSVSEWVAVHRSGEVGSAHKCVRNIEKTEYSIGKRN